MPKRRGPDLELVPPTLDQLWTLLTKEEWDTQTEFDLSWMLVSAAGYEVTKNGRGYVMRNRAQGSYRWQSCLRPFTELLRTATPLQSASSKH